MFSGAEHLTFADNGMVVDTIDVLGVNVADGRLAEAFTAAQKEAVELKLKDEQAERRISSSDVGQSRPIPRCSGGRRHSLLC